MKAILVEVTFPEAVFTQHYTKGFRETYPIPLPTSVAGMFGAMLGVPRHRIREFLRGKLFGAKLISYKGISREIFGYVKFKDPRGKICEWGPGIQGLVNNPTYLIAMASDNEDTLEASLSSLAKEITYLPYGGMNDHPATELTIKGSLYSVTHSSEVEGYAPESLVDDVVTENGGEVFRVLVKYRDSLEPFIMVYKSRIKLKTRIESVDGVPLYPIDRFLYQVHSRVGR